MREVRKANKKIGSKEEGYKKKIWRKKKIYKKGT